MLGYRRARRACVQPLIITLAHGSRIHRGSSGVYAFGF